MQARFDRERRSDYSPGVLWLLQATIVFGLVPLLSGIGIFLVWVVTRTNLWVDLGILLLVFVGPAFFLVGTICLVWHAIRALREKSLRWWPILGTAAVLLLNFPVAAAIVLAAASLNSEFTQRGSF